jgi:hypothetical protein
LTTVFAAFWYVTIRQVMTYAAYLRIYEPVSAFHEPDRSQWAAYAASAARPRRRDPLMVEHAEALRRAITVPPVVVPERESEHAYVRHAGAHSRWRAFAEFELAN